MELDPIYQVKTSYGLLTCRHNHRHLIASPNEHFDNEENADLRVFTRYVCRIITEYQICRTMTQLQVIFQNHLYSPHKTELCTHVVEGHQNLQSTTLQTIAKL